MKKLTLLPLAVVAAFVGVLLTSEAQPVIQDSPIETPTITSPLPTPTLTVDVTATATRTAVPQPTPTSTNTPRATATLPIPTETKTPFPTPTIVLTDDHHNKVFVEGRDEYRQVVSDTSTILVDIFYPEIGLNVKKELVTEHPTAGQELTFKVTVSNTGAMQLDVTLVDTFDATVLEYVSNDGSLVKVAYNKLRGNFSLAPDENKVILITFKALKPTV